MGLQVWFKDDLRSILLALRNAAAAAGQFAASNEAAAYQQGYTDALGAVATALGTTLPQPLPQATMYVVDVPPRQQLLSR